ncbi:MAG: hypothetical protein KC713_07520, partial [Candidatus Omnitrophica bacterium]|nr:hypothetical protein [Candidatus Omnitrophota bacterium]
TCQKSFIKEEMDHMMIDQLPGILWDLESCYQVSFDEIKDDRENPFAHIGFDGKKNCLGWTLPYYERILTGPDDWIGQVIQDANRINSTFQHVIMVSPECSYLGLKTFLKTFHVDDGGKILLTQADDLSMTTEVLMMLLNEHNGQIEDALKNTLLIFCCKSNLTDPMRLHKRYFQSLYKNLHISLEDHMMLICDEHTMVEKEFRAEHIPVRFRQFGKMNDIGERFSIPVSYESLLVMTMIERNCIRHVLEEAREMNDRYSNETFPALGVYLYNLIRFRQLDKIVFIVPDVLADAVCWFRQTFTKIFGQCFEGIDIIRSTDDKDDPGLETATNLYIHIHFCQEEYATDSQKTSDAHINLVHINLLNRYSIGGLFLGFQRAMAILAYFTKVNFVKEAKADLSSNHPSQMNKV